MPHRLSPSTGDARSSKKAWFQGTFHVLLAGRGIQYEMSQPRLATFHRGTNGESLPESSPPPVD